MVLAFGFSFSVLLTPNKWGLVYISQCLFPGTVHWEPLRTNVQASNSNKKRIAIMRVLNVNIFTKKGSWSDGGNQTSFEEERVDWQNHGEAP